MASSPTRMASSPPEETTETVGPTHLGPTLPSDLIFNIVSRLPVKVLGKFESVSKQWRNMITDPYFILTHRNRSLQNPNLLLLRKLPNDDDSDNTQKKKTTVEIRGLDFDGKLNIGFTLDVNDAIDMLPSKGDLICFAGENGLYICNPSTEEFVKLPEASCCTSGEVNAGMGYISSRNEYVLIHLYDRSLDIYVDNDIGCEVIRLSDGCVRNCSWKVVEANCPHVVRGWGVLVEDVFYWMIWEEYDHPGNEAIVSFDLEKEEFGTISPPEGCLDPNGVWSLVELRGSLCLVDSATQPSTMDIWVLKDLENHKWVKEYRIDLNGFSDELMKFIIPLDHLNGEILMDAKQESLHYYKSLHYYNVENKCFKRRDNLIAGGWTWLALYTESFFSLGSR